MPAKSHSKLPNKKAVLKELGLTGSNMSINIRLGSTRRLEASKTPTITACMSEEYLHKPVSCDALAIPSSSKILSDRPATAGYSLSSRRSQFAPSRRRGTFCSATRSTAAIGEAKPINNAEWARPSSSPSSVWSSSVDSDLATVGSCCGTESSLEEKHSFAVFSSSSGSRENLDHGVGHNTNCIVRTKPVDRAASPSKVVANVDPQTSPGRPESAFSKYEQHRERSNVPEVENDPAKDSPSQSFEPKTTEEDVTKRTHGKSSSLSPSDPAIIIQDLNTTVTGGAKSKLLQINSNKLYHSEHLGDLMANEQFPSVNDPMQDDTADEVSSVHTASEERASFGHVTIAENSLIKTQAESELGKKDHGGHRLELAKATGPNVLSEILNFLDGANHTVLSNNSPLPMINSETESNAGGFPAERIGSCENINKLRGMSLAELIEEVLSLQMLLQDKDNKLVVMERALQHQRELQSRSIKTAQRELHLRCKTQREEYETTLNRHVQFIQQLVDEKKKLAEKCEALVSEMRHLNSRMENERRINEERHSTEIRRLKQALGKDQRYHQEKWMADQTGKIREATARGLEPELRRLMGQHQLELQSLRSIHQEELLQREQAQMSKAVQQLNALREKMENEREDACTKEREIMRAKYEKELNELEALHSAKYQRLQGEMDKERKRWMEDESRMKTQEEENIRKSEEKWRREKLATQQLFQAELETVKQQHTEQITQQRRKWEEEKKEEIIILRQSLEAKFSERERHLTESLRKEREDDAHNLSRHFSDDLKRQHEEWKTMSEQQMQRIRDKHAEEINILDRAESELRNKLMETRRLLTDRDEELASLRLTLFQHVKENSDIKKTLEQYAAERNNLRNVLQKELENEFRRLENEIQKLQEDLTKIKSESRMEISKKNLEIAQMSASHEKMLTDIHEKVRHAVLRKDEAVTQMQEKLKTALSRCQHLEELLERQCRDLLSRKNFH